MYSLSLSKYTIYVSHLNLIQKRDSDRVAELLEHSNSKIKLLLHERVTQTSRLFKSLTVGEFLCFNTVGFQCGYSASEQRIKKMNESFRHQISFSQRKWWNFLLQIVSMYFLLKIHAHNLLMSSFIQSILPFFDLYSTFLILFLSHDISIT